MDSRQKSVCRWIRDLKTELNSTPKLKLCLPSGEKIALCAAAKSTEDRVTLNQVSLDLWLDHKKPVHLELGTCVIGKLHPLFSRLCIYAFLGVTHRDIVHLEQEKNKKKKKKSTEIEKETEKLLRLDFKPETTISKSSFEPAFNFLFYAVCHSRLIKKNKGNKHPKDQSKKFAAEMLRKIGVGAGESLMKSLASKRGQILSKYKDFKMDGLTVSYSSSPLISGSINCYCTRLEMKRTIHYRDADEDLEYALNNQLLHCTLGLDSVAKIKEHFIEVELTIDFLRCKVLQLGPGDSETKKPYIPAKIGITMWPECDFEFTNLFLGESSANPSASFCTAKSSETGFQGQLGLGVASIGLARKDGVSTSFTQTRTDWDRKRYVKDTVRATQEWILYDNSSRKPEPIYQPSFTKHDSGALKALAGVCSKEPLTQNGGVNFEGERGRGPPMTWRFNKPNINLEGKKLKWSVDVEVWLAHYGKEYMETRYKKFDGLSLVQDISTHRTEPQVPLKWVIVLCILFLFYNRFFN